MGIERESKSIITMIRNADFCEALTCLKRLSEAEQRDIILEEAAVTDDICVLGFVEFLVSQDNTYFSHALAAEAYIQMCHIEGAYKLALFHAWEMHKLKPDIETKKFLLFFYGIPEQLLPLEKARQIAQEILESEPEYNPALEIMSCQ